MLPLVPTALKLSVLKEKVLINIQLATQIHMLVRNLHGQVKGDLSDLN